MPTSLIGTEVVTAVVSGDIPRPRPAPKSTKGGTDGSATFNPGITGLKTGTTMVALTDIKSAMTINFTVVVK